MKYCSKCGKELKDSTKFCGECGTSVEDNAKATKATSKGYSKEDIEKNKFMGVLAYLGIFSLIPYFAAKDSKYTQYHAIQGINLFIITAAYTLLSQLIQAVIKVERGGFYYGYTYRITPWWVSTPLNVCGTLFFVLSIIGIINACKGEQKELPIIGQFKIIKK